jgi:transposase
MSNPRKKHSSEFKTKVAMAAIREEATMSELVRQHGVHATQIYQWKKVIEDGAATLFETDKKAIATDAVNQAKMAALHEKVGQLVMERDFFRERSGQ